MNMSDLKPCPFCGSTPKGKVRIASMGGDSDSVEFSIICEKCGTSKTVSLFTAVADKFADIEEAMKIVIDIWNTRAES